MGNPGELVAMVRLRRGVVGESRRVCHVVPVPDPWQARGLPERLTALCGEHIVVEQAELLPGLAGMPCEPCLLRSAPRQTLPKGA
ncbi:hypothetical protein SAMN05421810_11280 [Amycolatopsis arida]|uniref:Uncharacterized protein n=2 Tax=Amycolatopsis arida TaxID=587909 RepID=A0A1I6AFX0_9PSEU|nr:hypothetical protein CLV69_102807 [Amycolatopsis arida]SFQ67503.1 hypothetical protein SAMN05421810_11280 [Amycolatopsis arida]